MISLDVTSSQLVLMDTGEPIRLGHKYASAFLQRLLIASREEHAVVLGEAEALWRSAHDLDGMAVSVPDRTAIKRLVEAVEATLAQLPAGAAHLVYAPRTKTVGPWRLVTAPHVQWRIEGLPSQTDGAAIFDASELPRLMADLANESTRLADVLDAVNNFTLAEDSLRRGQYEDSAIAWRSMLEKLCLSSAGKALIGLRLMRALRRAGQFESARSALKQASLHARAVAGSTGDSLRAECAMAAARIKFDVARIEAVRDLDFEQLWRHAEKSLSPGLQAQWANLHALVARRRLMALHEAG